MKQSKNSIFFHNSYGYFYFPKRTLLKKFILKLIKAEGKSVEAINYIFCSDKYLLQINKQYLKHDTFTDIVTFELSEINQPLVSDIYISIDRVKENAIFFNYPFYKELLRVIFHGSLHLCGYKDKTNKDKKLMRSKEDFYLNAFDVPRGTRQQI